MAGNTQEQDLGENVATEQIPALSLSSSETSANSFSFSALSIFWYLFPDRKNLVFISVFFSVGHLYLFYSYVISGPHERPIPYQYLKESDAYVRDLTYNEKYRGETFSFLGLLLIVLLGPVGVQSILSLIFGPKGEFQATISTYAVAITLTNVTTEAIKNYAGYLRPIFFAECIPDDQYQRCTADDNANSARKSFPSGHASLAICSFLLLTLYLERKFGLSSIKRVVTIPTYSDGEEDEDGEGEEGERTAVSINIANRQTLTLNDRFAVTFIKEPLFHRINSILALLPTGVGLFVAASRVVDNMHFPADVVGGSVLGGVIAIYIHRLWFPEPHYMPWI